MIHGGRDGEIDGRYIQDLTLGELRRIKHDIPTLDEVFLLLDRQVVINIEVKIPKNDTVREAYNSQLLMSILSDKIEEYGSEHVFISCFNQLWLTQFMSVNSKVACI